jgi:hypothetical protein
LPTGKAAVSAEENLGGIAMSKPVSVMGIEPDELQLLPGASVRHAKPMSVIGIDPDELRWVKIMVSLLRHPDPGIPELARQALQYLVQAASQRTASPDPQSEKIYGLR